MIIATGKAIDTTTKQSRFFSRIYGWFGGCLSMTGDHSWELARQRKFLFCSLFRPALFGMLEDGYMHCLSLS